MITVAVLITHQHNVAQVEKELGPDAYRKGAHYYLNTASRREEVSMMVLRLNQLHGVQARILEVGDGDS